MSTEVERVVHSVERTLGIRWGQGVQFMTVGGVGGIGALSTFSYDLAERRVAMWSVFAMPDEGASHAGPDGFDDEQPPSRPSAVASVAEETMIYIDVNDGEWTSMPGPGLAHGPLATVYWLLGTVSATPISPGHGGADAPTSTGFAVTIDPALAVQRAAPLDRDNVAESLRNVDLLDAGTHIRGEVQLDPSGAVSLCIVEFDEPARQRTKGAVDQVTMRVELDELGEPLSIDRPTDATPASIETFVRELVDEPSAEQFRDLYERFPDDPT